MVSESNFRSAVSRLKSLLANVDKDQVPMVDEILKAKDEVLTRYQPIFSKETVINITEDDFSSFLLFSNNKHWVGLHRQGPNMTRNMDLLRDALFILIDEEQPVVERLDKVVTSSGPMVPGFGRATVTAILLIVNPDKYGVWNTISEQAMKELNIWPDFERGESFSKRYLKMNEVMNRICSELSISHWELDTLWWMLINVGEGSILVERTGDETKGVHAFGLERYLQEFLRDNWERIETFNYWNLYEEDGELVGYEYQTGVGRIDLLAQHKSEPRWLVIELKRGQTTDATVGQVLRYMGWVGEKLAGDHESVEGLIISQSADEGLQYALKKTQDVNLLFYEVDFKLSNTLDT